MERDIEGGCEDFTATLGFWRVLLATRCALQCLVILSRRQAPMSPSFTKASIATVMAILDLSGLEFTAHQSSA